MCVIIYQKKFLKRQNPLTRCKRRYVEGVSIIWTVEVKNDNCYKSTNGTYREDSLDRELWI